MLDYESTRIGSEEYVWFDGTWTPIKMYFESLSKHYGKEIVTVDTSSCYPGVMINEEV